MVRKPALFPSSGREAPGGLFRSCNSQSLGAIERVNFIYACANRSIPRGVAEKWLLKN